VEHLPVRILGSKKHKAKMILIVVPCYYEGERLEVSAYLSFLEKNPSIYFCFVNDGSLDNTLSVLLQMQEQFPDRIHIVNLQANGGKGEAVRKGILAGLEWNLNVEAIAFFDADLATPLTEVFLLKNEMDKGNYEMAFGSRLMRVGSLIERNPLRHYFGRVFATAASMVIPLPIYDTQCGAKLIKPSLAKKICQEPFISRWLFDLEIFARIINKYGIKEASQKMIEVPLTQWIEKGDSRLKFSHLLKVPYELWRIRKKYFG
jgi:dolichyl-phosphate beta-glucosyltransferase